MKQERLYPAMGRRTLVLAVGTPVVVCLVALCISLCEFQRHKTDAIPVLSINLQQTPLATVSSWRIVGSFRIPDADQKYSVNAANKALNQDYLSEIGGSERAFSFGKHPTNVNVDFDSNPEVDPPITGAAPPAPFYNQNITFPGSTVNTQFLFRRPGEFFKVVYAATYLRSSSDTDAVFLISATGQMKVWLNGTVVVTSKPESSGYDFNHRHIVPVHLVRGRNRLLVKFFCFPKWNEFAFRIATSEEAKTFVRAHSGLRDLLGSV